MQELINQALTTARGMWTFRWPALAVMWICAAVGAVAVWRIPDQYEATARVFVDTDSILKPLMSGLAVQPNIDQQVAMLSRTLLSRPNLERLIRMADLDLKSGSKAEQDALIERLQKTITMIATGGTNLYVMTYRDRDQERAKKVVQSMISIFVESGLGATRKDTDSAKTFLNEQIRSIETKLEEAEARVKEFRLRNIDRQLGDGKDAATRVAETTAQLEAARLQLREAERARDAAKRQIAELKAATPATSAISSVIAESSLSSAATTEVDSRLDAQRRNLDALLQRFTDQHPDVVSARRLIAELEQQKRKELQEAQRRAALLANANGGVAFANESLAQQEVGRVLASSEVQVASLQARVDEYSRRLAQAREQLKTAPQIEAEAAQLNRDYTVLRRNYDELVARRQSAVMSGELDVASGVTEFRLVDPPRVSNKPVAPNRLLLFPAAIAASILIGGLLAFVLSQIKPTFSDSEQLRVRTGLPVLGTVSRRITEADRRRQRSSLLRFVGALGSLFVFGGGGVAAIAILGR